MKKILITAVALALAVPALAAQQDIAQLSAVTASREALRTAINTQLSAVQANFDEVYAVIDAGPVYVNASAPADTKVVWIDTDQSNAIKVYVGGVWTVVGTAGEAYTLPTAAADTLGGVKVGARLTITDGVLSADVQTGDGSAIYPSAAGVANWGGSAWGTSYTVGTAANNLVQLNGSAQLPAVSAALLTNFPTLDQNTTGTAGGLTGTPNITVGTISAGTAGFGVDADGDATAKTMTAGSYLSSAADGSRYSTLPNNTSGNAPAAAAVVNGFYAYINELYAVENSGTPSKILLENDVDDTPVDGATDVPVSSNWAHDHAAAADPHTGYVLEDDLSGSVYGQKEIGWSVVASDTVTAVADGKEAAVVPASMNGMNLVDVTCSVHDLNSAASGETTVVLRRVRGDTAADMTSTGVTIDYNAYTASDATVDTNNDDLATGDKLYVDVNAVTTAAQKGLSCTAIFQAP